MEGENKIFESGWTKAEIDRFVEEYRNNEPKRSYKKSIAKLKLGGVDLESPDFIARHGVGFAVRLRKVAENLVNESEGEFRKTFETGMIQVAHDAVGGEAEVLARFFNDYGIDSTGALMGVVDDSPEEKEIMEMLCKQLIETEQI